MQRQGETGGSTQLDFSQAMADFKTMFPGLDDDVIEAVLRSNNGAVDATIDQLLTMAADNEPGGAPTDHASTHGLPSYTQAVDNVSDLLGAASIGASYDGGVSLRRQRNWNPPILGKLPSGEF